MLLTYLLFLAGIAFSVAAFSCSTISLNGSYAYAAVGSRNIGNGHPWGGNGKIYRSVDFGKTFVVMSNSISTNYMDIECSNDGRIVVAVSYTCSSNINAGFIYISKDYGITYTSYLSGGYTGVSISSDGNYFVAVRSGTNCRSGIFQIATSKNGGATWGTYSVSYQANAVESSADGRVVIIVTNNNYGNSGIYKSTNYGDSFTYLGYQYDYPGTIGLVDDASTVLIGRFDNQYYKSIDFGQSYLLKQNSNGSSLVGVSQY